jgi:hypothetical protein
LSLDSPSIFDPIKSVKENLYNKPVDLLLHFRHNSG